MKRQESHGLKGKKKKKWKTNTTIKQNKIKTNTKKGASKPSPQNTQKQTNKKISAKSKYQVSHNWKNDEKYKDKD